MRVFKEEGLVSDICWVLHRLWRQTRFWGDKWKKEAEDNDDKDHGDDWRR